MVLLTCAILMTSWHLKDQAQGIDLDIVDKKGRSALVWCAEANYVTFALLLLKATGLNGMKIDINLVTENGSSALKEAVLRGLATSIYYPVATENLLEKTLVGCSIILLSGRQPATFSLR